MRAPAPSDRDALAVRPPPRLRGRLFRKYVALFIAVVCLALLANGMFEVWFSYQEHRSSLVRIQREQAEAAASRLRVRFPLLGSVGLTTAAITLMAGTASCSSCIRFTFVSPCRLVTPVTLPPGWLRLVTRSKSIGLAPIWNTTGIWEAAAFAATEAGRPDA